MTDFKEGAPASVRAARLSGRAHVYGDDVDTDRIIAGKHTKTLDPQDLAAHVLDDLDPHFKSRVQPGDILVGGWNFGCGSSREQAPLALKAVGVSCVVASSFARIFLRNAVNLGLPVAEIGPHKIASGAALTVDLQEGVVLDLDRGVRHRCAPMPPIMIRILEEGGLVPFLARHGNYDV